MDAYSLGLFAYYNIEMRRRVFLAINLDHATIARIERMIADKEMFGGESGFGIRFLKPENWHITLSFLGYQDEDSIFRIINAALEAVRGIPPQKIELDKSLYGPPDKNPRMIWISASPETSRRLNKIKNLFEDKLEGLGVAFRRENREFHAHVTVARFEKSFRKSSLPPLGQPVNLKLEAQNLDLMESELKRGGAEYTILQRFPFKR